MNKIVVIKDSALLRIGVIKKLQENGYDNVIGGESYEKCDW